MINVFFCIFFNFFAFLTIVILPNTVLGVSCRNEVQEHLFSLWRLFKIVTVAKKAGKGSLSFGVKPKEAQEPLSEQTISDAVVSQPESPGRMESPGKVL